MFRLCLVDYSLSSLSSSPRCVELGRIKCTQYWPDKEGQTKWYGEIQVDFLKEHPCGSYILRMFSLKREVIDYVDSSITILLHSRKLRILHVGIFFQEYTTKYACIHSFQYNMYVC